VASTLSATVVPIVPATPSSSSSPDSLRPVFQGLSSHVAVSALSDTASIPPTFWDDHPNLLSFIRVHAHLFSSRVKDVPEFPLSSVPDFDLFPGTFSLSKNSLSYWDTDSEKYQVFARWTAADLTTYSPSHSSYFYLY